MRFSQTLFQAITAFAAVASALPASTSGEAKKYLVKLESSSDADLTAHTQWVTEIHSRSLARRGGETAGVEKEFSFPGYQGYSGSFDEETLAAIKANPEIQVAVVEPELVVSTQSPVSQENAPWALSIISNANPPSSSSAYHYDSSAGEGAFIYVFDSGILLDHAEFGGRAVAGYTGNDPTDLEHGTGVASMAGGATFGVAKKATLVNVQVMGSDSGSSATIVDGMTWTVNDIISKNRVGKSVINMSLSTTITSVVINDAVQAAIDNGIPVVAAAGNSNWDAVETSPANQPNAIAVAACNKNYERWAWSNWGSTVDIFAPGQDVTVASATGTNASRISSGTSEAAPVVAGVVAYLLALEGSRTPAEIRSRLEELAIKDKITDTKEVPNLLLYNGIGN
ncbi:unnamed protein product [Clonostachys rosea]|uniref:Peptidase S8/S53 domain-containing protein n=1 Tax=Bionectria ochroleuca TaxID=29856 RepID=A0ABY6UMX2_BIOOC|nr:unnamed protein product [Clonostachys rosea]